MHTLIYILNMIAEATEHKITVIDGAAEFNMYDKVNGVDFLLRHFSNKPLKTFRYNKSLEKGTILIYVD